MHHQIQAVAGKGAVLADLPKTASGDRRIPLPTYLLDMLKRRREEQLREMVEAGGQLEPMDTRRPAHCHDLHATGRAASPPEAGS